MAKSKQLSSYPANYFDIIERGLRGETITITLPTSAEAKALRFDLYGFIGALAHEGHPHGRQARQLTFTIDNSTLTATPRNSTEVSRAIDKALGLEPTIYTAPITSTSDPTYTDLVPESDGMTDVLHDLGFSSQPTPTPTGNNNNKEEK